MTAPPSTLLRGDALNRWSVTLFVFAGCAAVFACVSRGIWLDEFWSIRLGETTLPLAALVEQRWLRDTNPMTANLFYRVAAASGAQDIAALRLVLNVPAALTLLAATWWLARTSPTRSAFYVVFAMLIVGLPAFTAAFSDFRIYFWQLCAAATLVNFAYRLTVDTPSAVPRPLTALGIAALVAGLTLHFVSALIVSALVAVFLIHLVRKRDMRALIAVAVPAVLCWSAMLAMFVLQYRRVAQDMDASWIGTSTPEALYIAAGTPAVALLANPAATAFALLSSRDSHTLQAERAFVALLAIGVAAGIALVLLINAWRPIMVDRYLLGWQVALCGIVAVYASRAVAGGGWKLYLVVACSAASVALTAYQNARETGWDGTRDHIVEAVRSCPATSVYAISPWRLKAQRGSRAAALERLVFDEAYRRLAREAGFAVLLVSDAARVLDIPAECPALLWIEHSGGRRLSDPLALLRAADLRYSQATQISMYASDDGVVIAARHR